MNSFELDLPLRLGVPLGDRCNSRELPDQRPPGQPGHGADQRGRFIERELRRVHGGDVATAGASGSGLLLTVTFKGIAKGESFLTLDSVFLTEPSGQEQSAGALVNADITVPEPRALLLLVAGLGGLALRRVR